MLLFGYDRDMLADWIKCIGQNMILIGIIIYWITIPIIYYEDMLHESALLVMFFNAALYTIFGLTVLYVTRNF